MTEEPLYNIGVVTRLTGISIPTLHAWERRYKFPQTNRTAGGHRLYTEKDIAQLRWVKTQVDLGLAPSHAIPSAQALEESGRFSPPSVSLPLVRPPQIHPSSLQDSLYNHLLHNDILSSDRMMGEMLAFYSPEDLTINVIGPVLARIGDAWEKGGINIATEHLATNYLRHRLLMWMVTAPAPRTRNPIILACAPGEWHEGSLLMMGVLLRRRGWSVAYLGQDVPLQSFSDFIRDISPIAILLVSMRKESAQNLASWPAHIQKVAGLPYVFLGGRAFIVNPGLQHSIPGIYLGDGILEAVQKMESILEGTLILGIPTHNPQ